MICPYCGEDAEIVMGFALYPHRRSVANNLYWRCIPCDARVGCHDGTVDALGGLANKPLRYWRRETHKAFDPIWKTGDKTRQQAYRWLAKKLSIKKECCHIGLFDAKECMKAIEIIKNQEV